MTDITTAAETELNEMLDGYVARLRAEGVSHAQAEAQISAAFIVHLTAAERGLVALLDEETVAAVIDETHIIRGELLRGGCHPRLATTLAAGGLIACLRRLDIDAQAEAA